MRKSEWVTVALNAREDIERDFAMSLTDAYICLTYGSLPQYYYYMYNTNIVLPK
jgi:hypothetical protein